MQNGKILFASLAADEGLALDMGRLVVADYLGPAPALESPYIGKQFPLFQIQNNVD